MADELAAIRRRKKEELRLQRESSRKRREERKTGLWEAFGINSIENATAKQEIRAQQSRGWLQTSENKPSSKRKKPYGGDSLDSLGGKSAEASSPTKFRRVIETMSPGSDAGISTITCSQSPSSRQSSQNLPKVSEEDEGMDLDLLKIFDEKILDKKPAKPKRRSTKEKTAKKFFANVVLFDDDDEEDGGDLEKSLITLEKKKKAKKRAHNPLVEERREQALHVQQSAGKKASLKQNESTGVTALWSDSDTEPVPSDAAETNPQERHGAKRKTAKRKASKRPESGGTRRGVQGRGRPKRAAAELIDSSDSDHEDAHNELKPYFEQPKLGPPSALVPLNLRRLNGTIDQVPAAINRYLTPYQREGVSFIHGRVVEGKGAILGDDMGLGKVCDGPSIPVNQCLEINRIHCCADGAGVVDVGSSFEENWDRKG